MDWGTHNVILKKKTLLLLKVKQNYMCFSPKIQQPVRLIGCSKGSILFVHKIIAFSTILCIVAAGYMAVPVPTIHTKYGGHNRHFIFQIIVVFNKNFVLRIHCRNHSIVTHIDYLCLVRVDNNKLIHDTVEIKTDDDVAQIIKRWENVQRVDSSMKCPDTWQYIELFIQTRYTRSSHVYEIREHMNRWLNTNPWGTKFKYPFWL